MKKIFSYYFILLILIMFNCKDKSVNPPDDYPPGYQHDIPWPSLADSPWPMHHRDPQSTGRSKYKGPINGEIDFKFDSVYIKSGVSVDSDSTIYFISTFLKRGLISLNPDGSIKWINSLVITNTEMYTTPLVTSYGLIIIGGGLSGKLIAIDRNGNLQWEYQADGSIFQMGINIDKEGSIYFVASPNKLYSVTKNGLLKWILTNEKFNTRISSGISFSPDGNTLYVPGIGHSLFAIDIYSKEIKWSFGDTQLSGTPTIDSYGNIYLLSSLSSYNEGQYTLFCLLPNGTIKWGYTHNNKNFRKTAYLEGTIDKEGNYYFAFDTLYSVDFNGKLRWKYDLKGYSGGPLVCDRDGNIYLNIGNLGKVICVNKNGNLVWETAIDEGQISGHSPAISIDQKLYYPTFKSKYFYSLK